MIKLQNVCYVRLGASDLEDAAHFATEMLGLEVAGVRGMKFHLNPTTAIIRSFISRGDPNDHTAAFEVAEQRDLDDAAATLEKLDHDVRRGLAAEADARKVRDFVRFRDPTGNKIELVWRPLHSGRRYHGTRDAGVTGFSHIGLHSTDPQREILDAGMQCAGL